MVAFISLLIALFWFFFILFIFYVKQSSEAQVRRRLQLMIKTAEGERVEKIGQIKKAEKHAETLKNKNSYKSNLYVQVLSPIFDRLDKYFQNFVPAQIRNILEEKIFQAGKTGVWSLSRLISFWVVMVIVGTSLGVLLTTVVEFHFLQEALIILAGFAWGAVFPLVRLNTMIIDRQKKIRRSLPEFLDLLCVSVQAGLSFDGALSKITARMSGPLIDEFKRFQNDISLGMTHQYALNQVAKRCDLEEMYLFITSIIQAEKLGTSMGRTLKIQADNMRDRHRQFIKAEAMKAPVKIIFPMVVFIFPSIFVVLLLPTLLSFTKSMGG